MVKPNDTATLYGTLIITDVFHAHYKKGAKEFEFKREEIVAAAEKRHIDLPKNVGDVIYSVRYRQELPDEILLTQPPGKEWAIVGRGKAKYAFRLGPPSLITPTAGHLSIKVPDSTPELVSSYSVTDEQALLSRVRYNRLVDVFLGLVAYSLQNHLRTTVKGIGQIEIDEIYVGIDRKGCQYIIPVQAKGGTDRLSRVQTEQDIAYCETKYPGLHCRALSTQFMDDGTIAIFELVKNVDGVKIVDEQHYKLVPADQISPDELKAYCQRV